MGNLNDSFGDLCRGSQSATEIPSPLPWLWLKKQLQASICAKSNFQHVVDKTTVFFLLQALITSGEIMTSLMKQ